MRPLASLLMLAGLLLAVYVGVYQRFRNPQLTETEMFLAYWPECIVAVALVLTGKVLAEIYEHRRSR